MSRIDKAALLVVGLMVGLFTGGARAARAETLTATFTQPDGGITVHSYQGYVQVHVTGDGQSYGGEYNDAFYLLPPHFDPPQNGWDGSYYQLTFSTTPLVACDQHNAKGFLVGPLPTYSPAHDYTFVLNTGLSTPGRLHFGVSDCGYSDNAGAFTITVTQRDGNGSQVPDPPVPLSDLVPAGPTHTPGLISFLPPVMYDIPGGGGPVAADLDGDGKLDLEVTGPGRVAIFYGNGDGTFAPRVDNLIDSVGWTTVADVDGDGRPDLIVAQYNTVLILINQGERRFAPPVSYPVGSAPCGVTAADFNGDGKPDLAVANHLSNNMCVLLNHGDGTFAPAVFYPGGDHPARVACADFNGDGKPDLAMSNYVSGDVLVYFGDGQGRFNVAARYITGGMYPAMIVTDDFNGDGKPDLATANTFGNTISVFLGDGQGGFSGPAIYGGNQYPHIMASADLDGDGKPDILAPNNGTGYFTVLQNAGDGTFLAPVSFNSGGSNTRLLTVGDFNGDGQPDVVTGNESSNNISVLINNSRAVSTGPRLVVSAGRLDFTPQPTGTTSSMQTLTLTNTGKGPLTVENASLTGADAASFSIASDTGEATLAPGASRTIQVCFTPAAAAACTAALTIRSDDPRSAAPLSITLTGTGIAPAVTLGAHGVSFGNQRVGTPSDEQTLTVTNSGPAPLLVSGISITGPSAADFSVADPNSMSIDPGQSRTISLRFTPTARGSRSATLTLASNAPGSPHTVTLSGTGLGPVVSINPGSLSFGSQPVGTTKNTLTVLVQNSGDGPLEIRSVQLTGANPDDFSIVADGWTGASLLPNQIAILNLVFTPTAAGSRTASLTVQGSALDSPQGIPLSGTGTTSAVSLTPGSLSFTGQLVGTSSTAQTVTLTNAGDAPLTIHGVHFTGSNAGDFAATDLAGVILAPGQSRTIPVRFAPTAAGNRSASLAVSDSAADSPQTVALSGTGTAPSITFGISRLERPTRVSFGEQPVGSSGASQTLIVTNGGTGALTISSVRITGANAADFALGADSGGPILAPGASRNFTLRFKPASKGSRTASLTLSDNAAGSPHSVALQGVGVMVPPKAPGGLTLTVASYKEIQLTWVASSPETTSYAIWRKVGQGEFQRYSGVAGNLTRFVDQHVTPKTSYTYRVRANGPGGTSGWSNEAAGTTPLAPPPVAPTGLTVRALSASQMELRWTDTSSDETSFALWRKSGSGTWARVGGVPTGVSRYVDRKLVPNTSYSYQVRANGPGGVSAWSNMATGKTPGK